MWTCTVAQHRERGKAGLPAIRTEIILIIKPTLNFVENPKEAKIISQILLMGTSI